MKEDTWADPIVRVWIAQHALAIQVDVEEEPELAERLAVQGWPTVVALRGDVELGRIVGYRAPAQLVPWAYGALESACSA
jgi:hypothetical protein